MPQQVPARIELKPAQKTALAALHEGRVNELTRSAYEELTGMSRSQAAYDLADLVEAGVLERLGGGRSTRYRLAGDAAGKRRWTPERIRAELIQFCGKRRAWPSPAEFKASGRGDLYVAASRYGGIGFWAAQLGFPKQAQEPRAQRRLPFAVAGAIAGAAVVGAAVLVIAQWPGASTNRGATEAPKRARIAQKQSRHVTPAASKAARRVAPAARHRPARRQSVRHASPPPAPPTRELVVRTIRSVATSKSTTPTVAASSTGSGPSPLPAPHAAGGSPAPLAAPG